MVFVKHYQWNDLKELGWLVDVVEQVNAITLDPKIRKGSCRKKKKTAMIVSSCHFSSAALHSVMGLS